MDSVTVYIRKINEKTASDDVPRFGLFLFKNNLERERHKWCILKSLPFKIWDNDNSSKSSLPLVWRWGRARLLQTYQRLQSADWQAHFSFSGVSITEKVREGFDKSQSVLGASSLRGTWQDLSMPGALYGSQFKSLAFLNSSPVAEYIAWSINHESQVDLFLPFRRRNPFRILPKIQVTILTTCHLNEKYYF